MRASAALGRSYLYRGEGTGWFQRVTWNMGRSFSRVVVMLFFRMHVRGQAGIPKTGGVLLVTNHQSFLDPWLIAVAPARQIHFMARDTLFKGGFLHWLMELWNAFPVKRGSADLGAIRAAAERLDKGYVVNVFPEGTRSEDGTIGPVAAGISLIVKRCKTDVPIVPVVIDGAHEAWPRHAKMPRPRAVRIDYGRPIPSAEWRALSAEELARRVRRELVGLQEQLGSRHAGASRRRLEEEAAAVVPASRKRRKAATNEQE